MLFAAALLALPAAAGWTAARTDASAALGEVALQRIAALACGEERSGVIDHVENVARPDSRQPAVTVRCRPHGIEARLLLAHQTTCERRAGRWQCEPGQDVMLMLMSDGSTLAVAADGLTPEMAAHAVIEASRTTVPPFHNPGSWMLRGTCTVRQAPVPDFRGATEFAIACAPGTLFLTRHCMQPGDCRFFITHSEESAAQRPARQP